MTNRAPDEPDEDVMEKQRGARPIRRHQSLLVQIAILLTFALLPVGIIAVLQTQRAVSSAQDAYNASIGAQTARLVAPEQEAIHMAFGTARGLAAAIAIIGPEPEVCSRLMMRSKAISERFLFVGYGTPDLVSVCNSEQERFDFNDNANVRKRFEARRPEVTFSPSGHVTGQSVIVVSEPVFDAEGAFLGFVSVSFSGQSLVEARERAEISDDAVAITFNAEGQVLTSDVPVDQLDAYLPRGRSLIDLVGEPRQRFGGISLTGDPRDFALVPIAPGRAYALGSFEPSSPMMRDRPFTIATLLFPILMWLISLVVALGALHRQVVRPVTDLRLRMRSFADGRRVFHNPGTLRAPRELQEIGETFETMVDKVVRDEADLENTVHERGVLLREVHHRVKNNLQLMSSIMNMQSRKAHTTEARRALKGVQDRLNSLAAVHRALYQAPDVSDVRADMLLSDQVKQIRSLSQGAGEEIEISTDFQPITLIPDQASPLALLATEAFTNALKYVKPGADGRKVIALSLKQEHDEADIVFEIVNTSAAPDEADSAGLGSQLINAFSRTLGGGFEVNHTADRYVLTVRFPPAEFQMEEGT